MNQANKKITPFQKMLLNPFGALSFVLAILAIVVNPQYNFVIVVGGFISYLIMYQFRGYIYKCGLSRFYLLGLIVYLSILLSGFIGIDFSTDKLESLTKTVDNFSNIWNIMSSNDNQQRLSSWIVDNADGIFHWKMLIFAPAVACLFYLLNVEFNKKNIRESDQQYLQIKEKELFKFISIIDYSFFGFFIIMAGLYYLPYMLVASLIIVLFLWLRIETVAVISGAALVGLIVIACFNLVAVDFLILPDYFVQDSIKHSMLFSIRQIYDFANKNNTGQSAIFIPYLLFTFVIAVTSIRNKGKIIEAGTGSINKENTVKSNEALSFAQNLQSGKDEILTHQELNMHMFINGTTGSGKTVAFMNFVVDACEKNLPLVYIDGKGSVDLENTIGKIAKKYGRTFKVFSLSPYAVNNPMRYDFLGSGNYTERKNRVMNLFLLADGAGTDYYQDRLEKLVNSVFRVIDHHKLKVDLYRFLKLINNINDLIQLAETVDKDGSLRDYFVWIKEEKRDNPRIRLLEKLEIFVHSVYGYLFDIIDQENVINLKRSIENNEIVLFLLDASAYVIDTPKVAKMIISDLNSTFAEFGLLKQYMKTYCCFDEFKSYETVAIANSIALHRSNGMQAIIGTQSISVIDREIAKAIQANCNTTLVLSCSSEDDSRSFAATFGTYKKFDSSTHISPEMQSVTSITTKQIEDYIVSPQDIRNIVPGSGIGYLYRKAAGKKPVKVKVYKKY